MNNIGEKEEVEILMKEKYICFYLCIIKKKVHNLNLYRNKKIT